MYYQSLIEYIAKRLPHRTKRDVQEVLELFAEAASAELLRGGRIHIPDFGTLRIQIQDLKGAGALKQHRKVKRVYGRFRPAKALKRRIERNPS
jgi:nucleoid DNA-binding protein